jgi:acetoin utilization deacetylase AcuC-like enzyme
MEETLAEVLWITHPSCPMHEMGEHHPESPERLAAITRRIEASGLAAHFEKLNAPEAPREALVRVHEPRLVDALLGAMPEPGRYVRVDADTTIGTYSIDAARAAAGAVLLGVDRMLERQRGGLAFCAVRPPGHHAERARAMGFCLFNNVAVGAAHALERGLDRVAILDFDVHYGNGTADIFRHDPRVMVLNTFQSPFYPGWEPDPEALNLVEIPLREGSGSAEFRAAVTRHWLPALEAFQPEMLFVSAGFDAHRDDPLASLEFEDSDYHWIGQQIRRLAAEPCHGRVVATLEGGYEVEALARSVEAFVRAFVD